MSTGRSPPTRKGRGSQFKRLHHALMGGVPGSVDRPGQQNSVSPARRAKSSFDTGVVRRYCMKTASLTDWMGIQGYRWSDRSGGSYPRKLLWAAVQIVGRSNRWREETEKAERYVLAHPPFLLGERVPLPLGKPGTARGTEAGGPSCCT